MKVSVDSTTCKGFVILYTRFIDVFGLFHVLKHVKIKIKSLQAKLHTCTSH